MGGSKITRAGTKRTAGRPRAVGTRDRIIAHLAAAAEIADPNGMASTKLAGAVGYPGSSVAFAQLLSGMERDGLIARDVRGKRTYRIALPGTPAPATRPRRANPAPTATQAAPQAVSGLDYDELARRLLSQVIRRLATSPADLEQTVAGLERELATAWTRHGTLTAENVRLRQQLRQAQRDLDLARERNRRTAIAGELDQGEAVEPERLLDPDTDGRGQPPAGTASWRP
ncbi:hypothetical protein [Trebonia sp.]|uniref:hypothetical protein n=1 Tax=Trebonia sp. TaxID=2767075 RepID=UPI002621B11C|nr:hypothetical protein [Trebonia sp.]